MVTSSASDDWSTPPDLFAALNREFGPFDLDVCASADNAKCARYYTRDDDGLSQPWTGTVWCNPPYGRTIGQWLRKAATVGAWGTPVVCLVPAKVDTAWWREATSQAALVRVFPGRLKFGEGKDPAPFPSALIVFGALTRRHGTKPARCAVCQGWFYPARADATTCSNKCRLKRHRARNRVTSGQVDRATTEKYDQNGQELKLEASSNVELEASSNLEVFPEQPTNRCFWCQGPLPPPKPGRRRKFCSDICKSRDQEWRKRPRRHESPYEEEEPAWLVRHKNWQRGIAPKSGSKQVARQSPVDRLESPVAPEPPPVGASVKPALPVPLKYQANPRLCVRCRRPCLTRFCSASCRYGN